MLANFLLFAGGIFLYLAASDILEADSRLFPWPAGLLIVSLPVFIWFTYANDQVLARLVIHAVVLGAIFLTTSIRLFRKPTIRKPVRRHEPVRGC